MYVKRPNISNIRFVRGNGIQSPPLSYCTIKRNQPQLALKSRLFFHAPEGTRLHLLPTGADRGSPTSSRRRQQSTGLLYLNYSSPAVYQKYGDGKSHPHIFGTIVLIGFRQKS